MAALGTGILGFGGIIWQQLHRDRVAAKAEKRDAYHQMIAAALSFSIRAQALRETMRVRSGLADSLDVSLRVRPRDLVEMTLHSRTPLDPMALHDWLAQGYEPVNQAWSRIEIIGSAEAIEAATQLLDACADVVAVATQAGSARGRMRSGLIGLKWTAQQDQALAAAATLVVQRRRRFVEVARSESERERRRDWPSIDGLFEIEPRDTPGKMQIPVRVDAVTEKTDAIERALSQARAS